MQFITDFLQSSMFFGSFMTLIFYLFGMLLQKKFKIALCNPLLISTALIIIVLKVFKIDYSNYDQGAKIISYMLTPATICLAVPLYEQLQKLKDNWKAIIGGIVSGVLTNLIFIFLMCLIFHIGHTEYVSLLPKSITTAIGIAITQELGGIVPITMVMIVITGNLGNIFAVQLCRLFRITDPVAKGVAIGTSSHALGTAKAIEIGQIEGAMSGLSIAVAGLLTVGGVSIFAQFI